MITFRVLMIFPEVRPCELDFVREIERGGEIHVDALFVHKNCFKRCNMSLACLNARLLPHKFFHAALDVISSIRQGGYSIIYLGGWSEWPILVALFAGWLQGVPVSIVSDTHLNNPVPNWKRILKRIIYPFLFLIPKIFLPCGTKQAAYFRYYGVDKRRIIVLPMTVDVNYIKKRCSELKEDGRQDIRNRLGIFQNDLVFLYVGRFCDWKGILDLLAAFDRVSEVLQNARLLIVGDGAERKRVEEAAGTNSSIKYAGQLGRERIIEMYHASDVAVVPSHHEPWGLVINEAMAAGLPIIATNRVGSVGDLMKDGVTGKVIEAGNISAQVNAMLEMARDERKRKNMSQNAISAISSWTMENSARIICDVWHKVNNKKRI